MIGLEEALSEVLERERGRLRPSSHDQLRRDCEQMRRTAASVGTAEPGQGLYDAYMADDHGSADRHARHYRLCRLVDEVAGTSAVDPGGVLYNEPEMPGTDEAEEAIASHGLPADGVSVWHLAVACESRLSGVGLSASTLQQYWRAWRMLAGRLAVETGSVSNDGAVAAL